VCKGIYNILKNINWEFDLTIVATEESPVFPETNRDFSLERDYFLDRLFPQWTECVSESYRYADMKLQLMRLSRLYIILSRSKGWLKTLKLKCCDGHEFDQTDQGQKRHFSLSKTIGDKSLSLLTNISFIGVFIGMDQIKVILNQSQNLNSLELVGLVRNDEDEPANRDKTAGTKSKIQILENSPICSTLKKLKLSLYKGDRRHVAFDDRGSGSFYTDRTDSCIWCPPFGFWELPIQERRFKNIHINGTCHLKVLEYAHFDGVEFKNVSITKNFDGCLSSLKNITMYNMDSHKQYPNTLIYLQKNCTKLEGINIDMGMDTGCKRAHSTILFSDWLLPIIPFSCNITTLTLNISHMDIDMPIIFTPNFVLQLRHLTLIVDGIFNGMNFDFLKDANLETLIINQRLPMVRGLQNDNTGTSINWNHLAVVQLYNFNEMLYAMDALPVCKVRNLKISVRGVLPFGKFSENQTGIEETQKNQKTPGHIPNSMNVGKLINKIGSNSYTESIVLTMGTKLDWKPLDSFTYLEPNSDYKSYLHDLLGLDYGEGYSIWSPFDVLKLELLCKLEDKKLVEVQRWIADSPVIKVYKVNSVHGIMSNDDHISDYNNYFFDTPGCQYIRNHRKIIHHYHNHY
jgi:hypothetical protein